MKSCGNPIKIQEIRKSQELLPTNLRRLLGSGAMGAEQPSASGHGGAAIAEPWPPPWKAERSERWSQEGSPRIYIGSRNYMGFLDFNLDFLGFPILLLGFPRISQDLYQDSIMILIRFLVNHRKIIGPPRTSQDLLGPQFPGRVLVESSANLTWSFYEFTWSFLGPPREL